MHRRLLRPQRGRGMAADVLYEEFTRLATPDLPTNIVPTNIARLKLSGKSPMGLGISPLEFKIVLGSNPLKSTILVGGLGVETRLAQITLHFLINGNLFALRIRRPP